MTKSRTCPMTILLKLVVLSLSFPSRSIKVSLFVLTWNESSVKIAPDILYRNTESMVINYISPQIKNTFVLKYRKLRYTWFNKYPNKVKSLTSSSMLTDIKRCSGCFLLTYFDGLLNMTKLHSIKTWNKDMRKEEIKRLIVLSYCQ